MFDFVSVTILFGFLLWSISQSKVAIQKLSTISGIVRNKTKLLKRRCLTNPKLSAERKFDKTDIKAFQEQFVSLIKDVTECPQYSDMQATNEWLEKMLNYNVPFGKQNRGIAVAETYRYLMNNSITDEEARLSYILGWCLEILQASFLVADDIMDGSEHRRGRLAWFKVDELGPIAFNDSLFLESIVYFLLRKHFSHLACYTELVNEFHSVTHKVLYGQSLDTLTAAHKEFNLYTMDLYESTVKYKTSYYTFYMPVKLAMILAEQDTSSMGLIENILFQIGHYFQVQDDYLDCFGDPRVTGKVGTDIFDAKCTWLFVTAMETASPQQRESLLQLHGSDCPNRVESVTQIYRTLCLPERFRAYEESTYTSLLQSISLMNNKIPNSKLILQNMLFKIFHRKA